MTEMIRRTYSELILLPTFEERFEYLKLSGKVGEETFGFNRYLNQTFYKSKEWRRVRDYVIVRDNGCDLGIVGREIQGMVFIHHINPITIDDVKNNIEVCLDPEFLICTTDNTHKAIHYGDSGLLVLAPTERKPNDTIPWR